MNSEIREKIDNRLRELVRQKKNETIKATLIIVFLYFVFLVLHFKFKTPFLVGITIYSGLVMTANIGGYFSMKRSVDKKYMSEEKYERFETILDMGSDED